MFIVTSIYLFFAAAIYVGFVSHPSEVGLELADVETNALNKEIELFRSDYFADHENNNSGDELQPIKYEARHNESFDDDSRIPFCEALCVPKVLLYGITFFAVKFAVYALLLWMPLFLG
jgi:hypothetical protein